MRMYRKNFRSTYLMGAVKIKDGLFLGDEFSVRVLFDAEGTNLKQIREFISEGEANGEGILVHSVKGVNRSACALISYFMIEYKWSLSKSIEYITIRRPGLKIQQSFMTQLQSLEQRLKETNEGASLDDWNDNQYANEVEQVVKNTYLNSKTTATPQVIKRKIFNLNQMKKENIKLRWADHQPGGKLTQLFGVQKNKNFKISTVNFHSPTKVGGKGLASASSQTAHNFYSSSQQQTLKDKLQETPIENSSASAATSDKSNMKKAYIQSILKGSKKSFDKQTGNELNPQNVDESEILSKAKLDANPSPTKVQVDNQNDNPQSVSSFGQDVTTNPEESSEMTQSLSPQKISRTEQNRRLFEANPMSLSDQFNKPQQPQIMKNIFKLQQNQIKASTMIKDSNDQQVLKITTNNFTNPPKNTLANAYLNYSTSSQMNSNQQSPTKLVKTLNAPIRSSNFITTEESPDGQNEIPEEDLSLASTSAAKQAPIISNFSQYNSRTYNFRKNHERLSSNQSNFNNGDSVTTQEIQNSRLSEIQQRDINSSPSILPNGNVNLSDMLTSILLEPANGQTTQQQAEPQTQPVIPSQQQNSNVISFPKGLMSFKVVVLPKNNNNQQSDGSLRPNTASNIMSSTANSNQVPAQDPKFSSQRVNDTQNGQQNSNGMNAFKIAATAVEGNRAVYGNRVRPSSMDQQNRIFKQLNKKQITNKMNGNFMNNSSINSTASKIGKGNSGNNNLQINSQNINNFMNNNSNIVKQTQYQYKQAVQTYINANSVNQLSFANQMIDSNLFKKRVK